MILFKVLLSLVVILPSIGFCFQHNGIVRVHSTYSETKEGDTKNYPIRGVGNYLRIKDRHFIMTVSHLSEGRKNLRITTWAEDRTFKIIQKLVNNREDAALIEIEDPHLNPILKMHPEGIFSFYLPTISSVLGESFSEACAGDGDAEESGRDDPFYLFEADINVKDMPRGWKNKITKRYLIVPCEYPLEKPTNYWTKFKPRLGTSGSIAFKTGQIGEFYNPTINRFEGLVSGDHAFFNKTKFLSFLPMIALVTQALEIRQSYMSKIVQKSKVEWLYKNGALIRDYYGQGDAHEAVPVSIPTGTLDGRDPGTFDGRKHGTFDGRDPGKTSNKKNFRFLPGMLWKQEHIIGFRMNLNPKDFVGTPSQSLPPHINYYADFSFLKFYEFNKLKISLDVIPFHLKYRRGSASRQYFELMKTRFKNAHMATIRKYSHKQAKLSLENFNKYEGRLYSKWRIKSDNYDCTANNRIDKNASTMTLHKDFVEVSISINGCNLKDEIKFKVNAMGLIKTDGEDQQWSHEFTTYIKIKGQNTDEWYWVNITELFFNRIPFWQANPLASDLFHINNELSITLRPISKPWNLQFIFLSKPGLADR